MFADIIPPEFNSCYFNNLDYYDSLITKNMEKVIQENIQKNIENIFLEKDSSMKKYLNKTVEHLFTQEKEKNESLFSSLIIDNKKEILSHFEIQRKAMKNTINQLKDNFEKRCLDNYLDFFDDEFLIRKLKYKNIKNQNILLLERLTKCELKIENLNIELIKVTEINDKNKNFNDFIIKVNESLKNNDEKIIQINNVCQKFYNKFNNIDSQMNRNNYDLNNLIHFQKESEKTSNNVINESQSNNNLNQIIEIIEKDIFKIKLDLNCQKEHQILLKKKLLKQQKMLMNLKLF